MEPVKVDITLSIEGLVSKALGMLCEYTLTAINAKEEIENIKAPLLMFQATIDDLSRAIELSVANGVDNVSVFAPLTQKGGVLEQSAGHIKDVIRLLGGDQDFDEYTPPTKFSLRKKFSLLSLSDATWPLKRREVRALLDQIEACRGHIYAAFPNLTAQMVPKVLSKMSDFEAKVILTWLCPFGDKIKAMHQEKRALQEPRTCQWLLRDAVWKNWLLQARESTTDDRKFLWVHGIPGAGKTVMASFIIEKVALHCKSKGFGYYYCYHNRNQDETAPFLKWVLKQLCRQAGNMIPKNIQDAFNAEHGLDSKDLLDALADISKQFERVYLVVDAVDESKPRNNLTKTLVEIGTSPRFSNISLLFTSRKEADIQTEIDAVQESCRVISMSNPNVRADILSYIRNSLRETQWRKWSAQFLAEVETRIAREARGMFRYAFCQLDILTRLRDKDSIHAALDSLPTDIFDTYKRILVGICETDQKFARTALALICSETAQINSAEDLVLACLHDIPYSCVGRFTVDTLRDICGCLITVTNLPHAPHTIIPNRADSNNSFHRVSLAHYTVKEYLFFPGTAEGEAKSFALSEEDVRNLDLTVIFNGLSHFGRLRPSPLPPRERITRYEERCLLMTENAISESTRPNRRQHIVGNDKLRGMLSIVFTKIRNPDPHRSLYHSSASWIAAPKWSPNLESLDVVLQTLAPTHQHLNFLRSQGGINVLMRNNFPTWNKLLVWETWPAAESAGILANLVLLQWYELAEKYLTTDPNWKTMTRKEKILIWTSEFKHREKSDPQSLLTICLEREQTAFLSLFVSKLMNNMRTIRHGATFETESECLYTAMQIFYKADSNGIGNGVRVHQNLKMVLEACANPNPNPAGHDNAQKSSAKSRGRKPLRSGFIFTPLQFAVYNLEQDWVETLLEEGANPNMVGTSNGVIPSAFEDSRGSDDVDALETMGQRSCLKICGNAEPAWGVGATDCAEGARHSINELLLKYGAVEKQAEDAGAKDGSETDTTLMPSPMGRVIDVTGEDTDKNSSHVDEDMAIVYMGARSLHGTPPVGSRSPEDHGNGTTRIIRFRG
ncbi:hypothetical protein GGR57DRAFT_496907 [Xylariaceae sp. FL1272]|nr:hypothetical protein GGR57DRAFT_496907 [Xylariaceae sp. FL1272]